MASPTPSICQLHHGESALQRLSTSRKASASSTLGLPSSICSIGFINYRWFGHWCGAPQFGMRRTLYVAEQGVLNHARRAHSSRGKLLSIFAQRALLQVVSMVRCSASTLIHIARPAACASPDAIAFTISLCSIQEGSHQAGRPDSGAETATAL